MTLETPRLLCAPLQPEDAEDLFDYARDPRVGPIAGWPPHSSVADSREIISTVFAAPDVLCHGPRETERVVGSMAWWAAIHGRTPRFPDDELGYALRPDLWGRGLMPEADESVLDQLLCSLGLRRVWCGHCGGQSGAAARVIRKCGFSYWTYLVEPTAAGTG